MNVNYVMINRKNQNTLNCKIEVSKIPFFNLILHFVHKSITFSEDNVYREM